VKPSSIGSRWPTAPGERLRPLGLPRPVRVRVDARGEPVAVMGRRGPARVMAIREVWRIDDEWWRRPLSRLYYALTLETGRAVTLYRDLVEDRWYLQ
jgi:hypothetical protein